MIDSYAFRKDLIATNPLPPCSSVLYERIFAGNGVFLRAQRTHLSVCFPICSHTIPRLPTLSPEITLSLPKIPMIMIDSMMAEARAAWRDVSGPLESLFHFTYSSHWNLIIPEQVRSAVSVQPTHPQNCPSYNDAVVEIHSHHEMRPVFSSIDDQDETGFRIYGVCGNFNTQPCIRFRIGLYGHFYPIPASLVVELPTYLNDSYLL